MNITFNYPTCKWQHPITFDSWYTKQKLPALLLGVKFAQVKNKPEVLPYFKSTQQRFIDMLSPPPAPEVKKAENKEAKVENNNKKPKHLNHKVRFEYHPKPTLEVKFTGNRSPGDCQKAPVKFWSNVRKNGRHAAQSVTIPSGKEVLATISTHERFGTDTKGHQIAHCKHVGGVVHVNNLLGESPRYVSTLDAQMVGKKNIELMKMCNPSCDKEVGHKLDQGKVTKSFVQVPMITGHPNPHNNSAEEMHSYSKMFRAAMKVEGQDWATVELWVVVTGEGKPSKQVPVSFPEYWPLMVLHDPPGGGSFASYKNAKLTVDVELKETKFAEVKKSYCGFVGTGEPKS